MKMSYEDLTKRYKCQGFEINVRGPVYNGENSKLQLEGKYEGFKCIFDIISIDQIIEMQQNPLNIFKATEGLDITFKQFPVDKSVRKKGRIEVSFKGKMPLDSVIRIAEDLKIVEEYIFDNYEEMTHFDYYFDFGDRQVKEMTDEIRKKLSL